MFAKTFVVLCGCVFLIQTISAQCIGNGNLGLSNNLARAELAGARLAGAGAGYGLGGFGPASAASAASSGGCLTVSSVSPIAPTGITVYSDNAIEGPMEVSGQLPVLAAVGLEGQIATNGAAGTTYSCGNGQVGISSDSLAASGLSAGRLGAGYANNGFAGAGFAGRNLAGAAGPCGSVY